MKKVSEMTTAKKAELKSDLISIARFAAKLNPDFKKRPIWDIMESLEKFTNITIDQDSFEHDVAYDIIDAICK